MDSRNVVLDLAVDDYVGLWELIWRVREIAPPGQFSAVAAIGATVSLLLESGMVQMWVGRSFSGEERLVPLDESRRHLATEEAWRPAQVGESYYRIAATPQGKDEYERGTVHPTT